MSSGKPNKLHASRTGFEGFQPGDNLFQSDTDDIGSSGSSQMHCQRYDDRAEV